MSAWDGWTSTQPIRNRNVSPEWLVRFPQDGGMLAPSLGRHVFVVRLTDLNRFETECQFNIEVLEGPKRLPEKKILLVDDNEAHWLEERLKDFDDVQDAFWADILDGYNWEQFDTGPTYKEQVPVRFVGTATTVIWLVDQDDGTIPSTSLLEVCTELGNYLHSYVRVGGNLIIMGKDPVYACGYWSDVYPDPYRRGWHRIWNFDPDLRSYGADTTNFMWEVFGIGRITFPWGEGIPYSGVWTCSDCYEAFEDTIGLGPQAEQFGGIFLRVGYITELRENMDVRPLFTTAMKDTSGNWVDSKMQDEANYVAVYVPGNERRGHAAYIGFPAFPFLQIRGPLP
jgi:hypothetical protein